jgi:serine phosphatase RsbU (regulator of sigma subunit)
LSVREISAALARWADAVARHDAGGAAAMYSDDCMIVSLLYGLGLGRAFAEKTYGLIFEAFPDLVFEFDEPLIFGDRAVLVFYLRGTDTGGFFGQVPTGRPFSSLVVFQMKFRDGLITHERRIFDRRGLALQLSGDVNGMESEISQLPGGALGRALFAHDVSDAGRIQGALLPPDVRAGAGFEIAASSIPCQKIGGDFVDYFDLPGGMFGFAVGDIAGKGPPAALLAGLLQGVFEGHAAMAWSPARMLAHVNDVLLRRPGEARFATLVYGVITPDGRLTYCNAGHQPPLLVGRDSHRRLETGGLIAGAFEDATFDQEHLQLQSGDVVVVFTDGVTEAVDEAGEEFGAKRVLACFEDQQHLPASEQLDRLFESLRRFTGKVPQRDDLTALVLRYTG